MRLWEAILTMDRTPLLDESCCRHMGDTCEGNVNCSGICSGPVDPLLEPASETMVHAKTFV